MKSNELQIGVEYAVIPSWDYSSQDKKNPDRVSRRDVAKAKLVSLDKHEYRVYRSDTLDSTEFVPAPKGSRVVGYKVVSDDWDNKSTYWLSRAQDIVAPYDQLEARWQQEEQAQAEYERKRREEHERAERIQREAREKAERNLLGIKESLIQIIGVNRVEKIRFDINSRRDEKGEYLPHAEITMDSRIAQLLIEKVLEAKDLVG